MQTFKQYILRHKKILTLSLFMAAVNQIFSLLNPQVFRLILDNYAGDISNYTQSAFIKGVGLLLLLYIGVALVSRIAKAFQDYYVNVISERVGTELYSTSVSHVFRLPFSVFEDEQSGSILQKLQKARDHAKKFITDTINIGFFSLIGMLFVIIYSFTVHWSIGLVFLLSIPIVASIVYVTGKSIKESQKNIVIRSAELAASTTETLQNVGLVKSLGLEQQEILRLNSVNDEILALELKKVIILRKLSFIQGTLINAISTLIVFVSMVLIYQGLITLGEFLALWFYGFFVFGPLGMLADLVRSYQETKASLGELELILEKTVAIDENSSGKMLHDIQSITFSDVSFSYHNSATPSLESISLEVGAGETIALAGPSGSGKSTIIKLLLALYQPNHGSIVVNDHTTGEVDVSSLRQKVGYVPQESQVFAGTIRENLLFVKPHASDEECLLALKQSQSIGIIERSDKGLDTVIGENGIKLSGGEKQRLSIARALIRNPDILIFDEATSSLDSITEREISETIDHIRDTHPELIMIIIAHRLSTIEKADRIYVLKRGALVEQGTHTSLVNAKGLYYSLWNEQQ